MRDPVVAKLVEIRDRDGLTNAALARKIGVDSSYMHLIFRGEREAGRKLLDGAIIAFPELADVYTQALTIRRLAMANAPGLSETVAS